MVCFRTETKPTTFSVTINHAVGSVYQIHRARVCISYIIYLSLDFLKRGAGSPERLGQHTRIGHSSSSMQNWGFITDWEASIWSKGLGSYFTFC